MITASFSIWQKSAHIMSEPFGARVKIHANLDSLYTGGSLFKGPDSFQEVLAVLLLELRLLLEVSSRKQWASINLCSLQTGGILENSINQLFSYRCAYWPLWSKEKETLDEVIVKTGVSRQFGHFYTLFCRENTSRTWSANGLKWKCAR